LSNGTNPEKVDEYLGDCFDGMKCLDFVRGPGIPYPSKRAKGMFSKEDEYVPFFNEFTMAGLSKIIFAIWKNACNLLLEMF